jgi:tetratricopeptide (TPR) repeat protein
MYRRRENLDATGSDPGSAVAALPQREPAIGELIHQVGEAYARRIAPVPVPVERSYFGESDNAPAMAAGTTLAESGRWQAAADAWEAGISQAPKREAGQLAYNIAIAYEKLGRTELAQEWARKASEEYGNSQARTYLAELGKEKKDTLDIDTGGNIQMPGVNINKE